MIKSLYVHIPFCVRKCLYCDFNSYSDNNLQDKYVDSLIKELKILGSKKFETVFVGGGTPTILSIYNLEKLLKVIKDFRADEYTFECNPGTLSEEKLSLMKQYGVNRLSIGLQAWQDNLLQKLGRIHKVEDFLKSFTLARNAGFKNINIDLMFGLPDQTLNDWKETIRNVLELKPEHLSCYSLIIEEGTPFNDMNENGKLNLPDEEIEREMYWYAAEKLKGAGFKHYEISNYAKQGYECRHNITYWKDEQYFGCGSGAHSYINNTRYSNIRTINGYIKGAETGNTIEDESKLSDKDEMSEFMFLGLRMTEGISKQRFKDRFGISIDSIYSQEIKDLVAMGLLLEKNETLSLTSRGIEVSNQVFIKFLK